MSSPPLDPETVLQGKDLPAIFRLWEEKNLQPGYDPVPVLRRLSEIFEEETAIYVRKDPDPFDERHPSRSDPNCELGRSLKLLFKKDHFMTKLVNDYLKDNFFTRQTMQKSSLELNIAACRLILVIMPGLETSAVFQSEFDHLLNRLYNWGENAVEPLQSYACGLLAAAMEVQDIAVAFREQNTRLVPKMLKRLHVLQEIYKTNRFNKNAGIPHQTATEAVTRLVPDPQNAENLNAVAMVETSGEESVLSVAGKPPVLSVERPFAHLGGGSAPTSPKPTKYDTPSSMNGLAKFGNTTDLTTLLENDASQSNIEGKSHMKTFFIPIHPPTTLTSQMLILRYLTSMGEYQEFLGQVFEQNAMDLIFGYIENLDARDTCIAFEALKYLASLLCHKKFALDFISRGGLERLLQVPRPSMGATGVSITLYYLAYCEEAMERICAMPHKLVAEVVKYALWLLECSHDSGKCHAIMFFGLSFQFKVILEEFDKQDGLRQLYNVIAVLPILAPERTQINDDEECAFRQLVRHVCVALKRYMESHLHYKYNHHMRQLNLPNGISQSMFKAQKATLEQISEQVRTLQENLPVKAHWAPVDELLRLGCITLLLRIIAYSYDWNNSGRSETVRSALDVLSICCVIPKVYLVFCDRLELPEHSSAGINAILGAAIGEIVTDVEVQKAALAVLVHCVCAPLTRQPQIMGRCASAKKKINNRYCEELVQKVWESVGSNNGIIVLLQLMQVKTPITDADCIRGMACRALAGLARSQRVRQIIGKLPLFANGQLQHLMRDPILQEKRAEHVTFQKHALELLEQVSGRTKPASSQVDASLANIHKANVVAQTRIQFNEQQLFQLIHEHLAARGMQGSAAMLVKEANLSASSTGNNQQKPIGHHSPFSFRSPSNAISRTRLRSRAQELNLAINSAINSGDETSPPPQPFAIENLPTFATSGDEDFQVPNSLAPIKLIKKSTPSVVLPANSLATNSHLQKSLQRSTALQEPQLLNHSQNNVSLTTIVTEYLTNQHALCNNPMSTCPQFDLFLPHKCPDPKPNKVVGMPQNLTARLFKAQAGYNTMKLDRRFVHSNFCPYRTIRSTEALDTQFTCCQILPCNTMILVGTFHGEAKLFSINEGTEETSAQCHSSFVDSVTCNRDGNLAITSTFWRPPLSILWSVREKQFVNKLQFTDEFFCEFSNIGQDKILGTKSEGATIYDLNTGTKVATFTPTISNQYTKNRATFCPTDELILSDGVLWDVRAAKEIHKFDKLNQTLSGLFHPNGLEIVSNTEIWDLRTFHLLRTVPVLDQCHIKFSPINTIYGYSVDSDTRIDFEPVNTYESSFKVLDAFDYESISTIDVKRNIYDISINKFGSFIAVVENQGAYDSVQESSVRVYSVGVKKTDEQEEEEDEEMESDENSGSSDSNTSIPLFRIDERRRRRRGNLRIEDIADDADNDYSDNNDYDFDSGSSDDGDDNEAGDDDAANDDAANEDAANDDALSDTDDNNFSWSDASDMDIEMGFL